MDSIVLSALKRSGVRNPLCVGREIQVGSRSLIFGRPQILDSVQPVEKTQPADLRAGHLAVRFLPNSDLVSFGGESLTKPFVRYDFANEWNNLGYGSTSLEARDDFGLSGFFEFDNVTLLAEVIDIRSGKKVCDYAWTREVDEVPQLWFNRRAGPADGYDWAIVEKFLSQMQASTRAGTGHPIVSEIPWGFESAVTMRIDCDEAIASGRELFELYREKNVPFSMAIKTQQEIKDADLLLMRDVIANDGSVVGHSHTHKKDWGGSREAAAEEIRVSHEILRSTRVQGINYDFVVSPFHQNSLLAVQGLKDAGIKGFVGGIICNDPRYLLARAGEVPDVEGMISHSQQCMLHGDCYHQAGNSLHVYKQAYRQARETKTFFGFLDHPFSSYAYGWSSEKERRAAHAEFLDFFNGFENTWKVSLVKAMRFLEMKSKVVIENSERGWIATLENRVDWSDLPPVAIEYGGTDYQLKPGGEVRIEI